MEGRPVSIPRYRLHLVLAAFTLKSGVSTSLAGVAAAFTVPIGPRRPGQEGVLKHFMQSLHPYVAFAILPLFAFTAAGFSFAGLRPSDVLAPIPLGIAAGLFLGKQAGVLAAVFGLVRSGLARRPTGSSWLELYGVAILCGVGFTLSLFIGALAFAGQGELARSQMTLGVAVGSIALGAHRYDRSGGGGAKAEPRSLDLYRSERSEKRRRQVDMKSLPQRLRFGSG